MAYTPNTLVMRSGGFVEGGFNVWEYTTPDALNTVLASGYFSDGSSKGMLVGDLVWVVNQSTPSVTKCQCSASTVTTTGGLTQHVGSSTVIQQDVLAANFSVDPRNLLDGGDFTTNPFQRNSATSAVGSLAANIGTTATYYADRWFACGGTTTYVNMSQQTQTDVPGFGNSLRLSRLAAPTQTIFLGQVIETFDSIRAQGQPVCLSWWAKAGAQFSAASGVLTAQVISGTGTADGAQKLTGVGGSSWTGAATAATGNVTLTTAAQRFSVVGTVPANCTELGALFSYAPTGTSTTTDSIDFYGIQLEVGQAPSAFEHLDVEVVLAECQRYFIQVNEPSATCFVAAGSGLTATTGFYVIALPTQMRVAPTVTVAAGSFKVTTAAGATVAATIAVGPSGHIPTAVSLTATASGLSIGGGSLIVGGGGSGYIQASAEF